MWRQAHGSPVGRRASLALSGTLLAAAILTGLPAAVSAASIHDTVTVATVSPRVFEPGGDPAVATTTLHYELQRTTSTTVQILDYAGHVIRLLQAATIQGPGAHDIAWDGLLAPGGPLVQDAGYRFRLTVQDALGSFWIDLLMTKAPDAIFPVAPGTITVAIDPGHGGPDPGAIRPPLAEKTANLQIALRLRAMLLGAGVNVVMTRTGDTRVNRRAVDWTRDGLVAYRDELASRIEIANAARADVFIVVHNNGTAPGVGGTETWFDPTRPFGATNRVLAGLVQTQLVKYLRTQRTSSWSPIDRGIHMAPFYVLRKFKLKFNERPSEMPGILGESLAMGHPYERRLLRSGSGTQAIAEGYYEALTQFFAGRTWGAKYTLLAGPGVSAAEGSSASTRIRVTNTSPRDWAAGAVSLTLSAVRAVPWYDGTAAAGAPLATVALPALASGASADVDVPFSVPSFASVAATGHRTILKADLVAGTTRLELVGVPPLQQWLTITSSGPTPPPTPTPSPTDSPTPSPTDSPTASPTSSPTDSPTPPTARRHPRPTARRRRPPTARRRRRPRSRLADPGLRRTRSMRRAVA